MDSEKLEVGNIIGISGRKVFSVTPETKASEAAGIMTENHIGLLVISETAGKVVGVLSERDIVRSVWTHGDKAAAMTAMELMTRDLVGCKPSAHPKKILTLMKKQGFRHIPVLNDGEVIGIISFAEILLYLLNHTERAGSPR